MTAAVVFHALGWSLLHFCWQGAAVMLVLALVSALLRNQSPQSRYAAACGALALMAVLPVATFAYLVAHFHGAASLAQMPMDGSTGGNPQSGFNLSSKPWIETMEETLNHWMPWVLPAWFSGAVLFLGRLSAGLLVTRRMKRAAEPAVSAELQNRFQELLRRLGIARPVRLIHSVLVEAPAVIGWLRPVVLLPLGCLTGLSTVQIDAVLAHELAHIRRHDYLVSILQSVVESLLFYHPAVWWVSRLIRSERELCCDDFAVMVSGDSLVYAKALSYLEERRSTTPAIALGAQGGVLAMRIRRLLGGRETPAVSRAAALSLLALVLAAAVLYMGVARAQSNPAQSEEMQKLAAPYQKWLTEDVLWIVTPEERTAFLKLASDDERDRFIQQFWERQQKLSEDERAAFPRESQQQRDAAQDAQEEDVRTEHYRRIAYANQHFATDVPGWKTDRGRIYILYGRPESIDSHPSGGTDSAKPYEVWHYKLIQDFKPMRVLLKPQNQKPHAETVHFITYREGVDVEFVDFCGCGDYRMQPIANNDTIRLVRPAP